MNSKSRQNGPDESDQDESEGSTMPATQPETRSANEPFILASGSPRRKDLLTEAGFVFSVQLPQVEEMEDPAIPIRRLTAMNAALKCSDVAGTHPGAVVLGADTLVLLEDQVFGKPADRREADEMLAKLNGRAHQVYTAVCIKQIESDTEIEFSVSSNVTFKNLSEDQRNAYLDSINPLDKAGAYAAQENGAAIIASIVGSLSNVIGLPMNEVLKELRDHFHLTPDL